MARKRWRVFLVCGALLGILGVGVCAMARENEQHLLHRIQNERNPVKKAKLEIKLAKLQLAEVQDAYGQGHTEVGAKLLGTFLATMKGSWKLLQSSGRNAAKKPDGFRELEISLRENGRDLQDLGRTVSYFDRAPVLNAAKQLDQMRGEVLHALFPEGYPLTRKKSPPPSTALSPAEPRAER